MGAAFVALFGVACATTSRDAVGQTSTTAGAYAPGSVELYMARSDSSGGCSSDLARTVDFAPNATDVAVGEVRELERWARCLSRPELEHATLVLVGGQDPNAPDNLFVQRAMRIREVLSSRGVDVSRIVIGAPNATREGGRVAETTSVRLELTTAASIAGMRPSDAAVMRGIR